MMTDESSTESCERLGFQFSGCSTDGSALVLGARGRRSEPCHSDSAVVRNAVVKGSISSSMEECRYSLKMLVRFQPYAFSSSSKCC